MDSHRVNFLASSGVRRLSPRRPPLQTLSCLGLCLLSQGLYAAEYSVKPRAQLSAEFDDNKLLRNSVNTPRHDSVVGSILDISAELAIATETSTLNLTPRGRLARYTEYTETNKIGNQTLDRPVDLDYDNVYVDFGGKREFERVVLEMEGNYTRDTVLTSETLADQPSGFRLVNTPHQSISVNPSVTYEVSERNALKFSGSYADVTYEEAPGYSDYTYQLASLTDLHKLTERDEITGTVFYSRFEAPEPDQPLTLLVTSNQSDNIGFQAGYTRIFSETLKGSIGAGFISSDLEFAQFINLPTGLTEITREKTSDIGLLLDASLEKEFENTTLNGTYSRSVSPSGYAAQDTRDALRLSAIHNFTERLESGMFFDYTQSESQGGGTAGTQQRDYLRLEARLRYRLSEYWSLIGSYIYSRQDSDNAPEAAESNAALVSLSYDGQKWSMSR